VDLATTVTPWLLLCALLVSWPGIVAAGQRRDSALARVEAKLDLLLKNAGLAYDHFADVPPGVVEALRRGEKIAAIKRYREATGVGLKEAKEFVEEVQRRDGLVA
jgi:Ribosomal protein L7/L12 C-terminal domain